MAGRLCSPLRGDRLILGFLLYCILPATPPLHLCGLKDLRISTLFKDHQGMDPDGKVVEETYATGNVAYGDAVQINGPNYGLINLRGFKNDDHDCVKALYITNPENDKQRIEDSKGPLLKAAYDWILGNDDFRAWHDNEDIHLLWINGSSGTGKTMLLCGILDYLKSKNLVNSDVLAYFFCDCSNKRTGNATAVLRGLIFMLAVQEPDLVGSCIRPRYDRIGAQMFVEADAWYSLSEIFGDMLIKLSRVGARGVTYLAVDALDECESDYRKLLVLVAKHSIAPRVKWIVTSRGWHSIGKDLRTARVGPRLRLDLDGHRKEIRLAIDAYIKHHASEMTGGKTGRGYHRFVDGLREKVKEASFLYASLVVQHLKSAPHGLEDILEALQGIAEDVHGVYKQAVDRIRSLGPIESDRCQRALCAVVVAYQPLCSKELSLLARLRPVVAGEEDIMAYCKPFITMKGGVAHFLHPSAKEFLQEHGYFLKQGIEAEHHRLFSESLRVMGKELRCDMYGLSQPGRHINRTVVPKTGQDPLAAVRYSCGYWIEHLVSGNQHDHHTRDGGVLSRFLERNFLHWLEYIGIQGDMHTALSSWTKLIDFLKRELDTIELTRFAVDAYRFMSYNGRCIMEYPLQAYTAALVFAPSSSWTRQCFREQEPRWVAVNPAMEQESWSPWLQALDLGEKFKAVGPLAFSSDGARVASVLDGRMFKIWDLATGQCLKSHPLWTSGNCTWASFSLDSTILAIACEGQVRYWNVTTGGDWGPAFGSGKVSAAAFSPDGIWLATADDCDIDIWDFEKTDRPLRFPHGCEDVHAISFSPNGAWLASAHHHGVCIWSPETGKCLRRIDGKSRDLIAFSSESSRLVLAHRMSLRTWDPRSGEHLQTLDLLHQADFSDKIALSANGTRFAVAYNNSVKIWNVATRRRLQTLKGYHPHIQRLAFSPDGTRLVVAGAWGLKVWESSGDGNYQTVEDHMNEISCIRISANYARIVSVSNEAIMTWDPMDGSCLGKIDVSGVQDVAISPNGSRIISISDDDAKVWNLETCKQIESIPEAPLSAAFSSDGRHIAVLESYYGTVRLWKLGDDEGNCGQFVGSPFEASPDGWSDQGVGSNDGCVVFVPDTDGIATSFENVIRVWHTQETIHPLELEAQAAVKAIKFSSSKGQPLRLVALCDGEIVAWNLDQMVPLWTLKAGGYPTSLVDFRIVGSTYHVLTNVGAISYDESSANGESHRYGYGIDLDNGWITFGSERALWLPPDYRPQSATVVPARTEGGFSIAMVVLGCCSRRTVALRFPTHKQIGPAIEKCAACSGQK